MKFSNRELQLPLKPNVSITYRAALVSLWVDFRKLTLHEIEASERRTRIVVTVIWFILSLILAAFIPNIGVVIEILGAFAAVFIFIFPG